VIRIFGAGYWRKGRQVYERENQIHRRTTQNLKVAPDFLPRPEELVFRDEGVNVTIALSKRSVEFFKNEARKHNTPYQRMIRRLLDAYAERYSRRLTTRSTRTRAKAARPIGG